MGFRSGSGLAWAWLWHCTLKEAFWCATNTSCFVSDLRAAADLTSFSLGEGGGQVLQKVDAKLLPPTAGTATFVDLSQPPRIKKKVGPSTQQEAGHPTQLNAQGTPLGRGDLPVLTGALLLLLYTRVDLDSTPELLQSSMYTCGQPSTADGLAGLGLSHCWLGTQYCQGARMMCMGCPV